MKLVERLARVWSTWEYGDCEVMQNSAGRLYIASIGGTAFLETIDTASDHAVARVTRPQWQAERDRMKAMGTQQATASTEPTYEQQLWDSAAIAFISAGSSEVGACVYADAFMAERAKRVGK